MAFNPLARLLGRSYLGIDIGGSSIKIVEISGKKGKTLENYGQLRSEYFINPGTGKHWKAGTILSDERLIQAIRSVLREAKIKTKNAFFAIPDYSTFFTSFELPPMSKSEIEEAIRYEAPRHIPLP